jgi:hypothetical protein
MTQLQKVCDVCIQLLAGQNFQAQLSTGITYSKSQVIPLEAIPYNSGGGKIYYNSADPAARLPTWRGLEQWRACWGVRFGFGPLAFGLGRGHWFPVRPVIF